MENDTAQPQWRQIKPGKVCSARVWGSPASRAVTIEVTAVVAADDSGYEVFGYRLDRLQRRFGHMQNQRPRHYWVPINWVSGDWYDPVPG